MRNYKAGQKPEYDGAKPTDVKRAVLNQKWVVINCNEPQERTAKDDAELPDE